MRSRGARRAAATVAVTVLAGAFTVAGSGPASAGGGKPRNECEITFRNDTRLTGELQEAQAGPGDRWTRRPEGNLRPSSSLTFSAEDWPPPGPCRITVSYRFLDQQSQVRTTAVGMAFFDGKEADGQCNVYGDAFKCTTKKNKQDSSLSVDITFEGAPHA